MLVLHPQIIGEPHYEELAAGDIVTALCDFYNPRTKRWENVPWFESANIKARMDAPNYRRPVTLRAKVAATWRAVPKWFKVKVLRKPV